MCILSGASLSSYSLALTSQQVVGFSELPEAHPGQQGQPLVCSLDVSHSPCTNIQPLFLNSKGFQLALLELYGDIYAVPLYYCFIAYYFCCKWS